MRVLRVSIILIILFAAACLVISPPLPEIIPGIRQLFSSPTPTPSQTPTPTHTATLTGTPTSTTTLLPSPTVSPTPTFTPTLTPQIVLGAGDIAYCGSDWMGDEQTSMLLERYPETPIITAGDNVQGVGAWAEYVNCFGPTWGRFIYRIHPSPGNHDYYTNNGANYYAFFGDAAGPANLGYYSYDLGDWHFVSLNGNCDYVGCGKNSAQAAWLRADLAASKKRCTLLYWHQPRWSSGGTHGSGAMSVIWRIAAEMGAEIVVNGHDHNYERFTPMDGDGNPDPNGLREFVVGTGGAPLRDFGEIAQGSEVRSNQSWGVIKFTLFSDRYEWEFIPVEPGIFTDSGEGFCH